MEPPQELQKNVEFKEKQTYHLVSMPQIILTRLDEKTIASSMTPGKKVKSTLNKSALKKSARPSSSPTVKRIASVEVEKRKRGRPKKFDDMILPTTPLKKLKTGKELAKNPKVINSVPKKSKQQGVGVVKNMLNKTMLQKRSKITIPVAKKAKTALTPQNKAVAVLPKKVTPSPKPALTPQNKAAVLPKKVTPKSALTPQNKAVAFLKKNVTPSPKQSQIKPFPGQQKKVTPFPKETKKVVIPQTPQPNEGSDSSEDEFLYDELIEELQISPNRIIKSVSEKTTNITIKSNDGNNPPRIVKGGIVRKVNLPPDLKKITSPNTSHGLVSEKAATPSNNLVKYTSRKSKGTKSELENHVPAKKASPWPVNMSPPSKTSVDAPHIQKKIVTKDSNPVSSKENGFSNTQQKLPESANSTIVPKPDAPKSNVKRKMGPKQVISEYSNSQFSNEDDSLSEEYTEEETLEIENPIFIGNSKVQSSNATSSKPLTVQPILAIDSEKDDDDPNLDLLRILTDDTEEPYTAQSHEPVEVAVRPHAFAESDQSNSSRSQESVEMISKHVKPAEMPTEDHITKDPTTNTEETSINDIKPVPTVVLNEDPPVRTIYDLMNEVSLQNPSWNLHIIPETNAFCIAQVTKGRLGLPTLKKCIELDPEDFSAKVYIHQYHIKRFDGVYDNEESISALIDEINSIRA